MYYEIENALLKVGVETAGAQLKSVYSKKTQTEYLWQGDENYWKGRAYNLFPIVGRAYDGKYLFRGKTYEIRPHGLARDNEFILADRTATKLVFSLSFSQDTLKIYPCKFVFSIVYEIKDAALEVTYSVKNVDETSIAFCLGAHPGFNIPFHPTGEFEDYFLEFPEKSAVRQCLLSKSKLISGERTPYLLAAHDRIPLMHESFANDAIILAGTCRAVSLKRKRSKRFITLRYPDFRYLGIWQTPDSDAPFVCLEPWTALPATDGEVYDLEKKEDATVLPAGQTHEATWTLELHE